MQKDSNINGNIEFADFAKNHSVDEVKTYIEGKLGFDLKAFNQVDFAEEAHERDNLPNPFDVLSLEELVYLREHHYFLD